MVQFLACLLLPACASALAIWFMLRTGRAGPLDQPNHRSLHSAPVPRSGGIGILAGVAAGALFAPPPPALTAAVAGLALLSWWDDRHSLPVAVRFAGHFVATGLVLAAGASPDRGVGGLLLFALAIVWVTNLYNFMDGANGLAGGMAVFGFGAFAVAAGMGGQLPLAMWSACIAAAAAGFLFFNFDPARIFMGDVGSIPLGFLAATLGLEGMRLGVWPVWFPVLVFAPFVVDATVTLLRRALRGEKVWRAHREHYYQRLVRAGWSHRKLALHEYGIMAALAASGCAMLAWPFAAQMTGLLVWAAVLGGMMLKIDFGDGGDAS